MLAACRPGLAFHANHITAHDPTIQVRWQRDCLDGFRNCSGGELGDGTMLKDNGLQPLAGITRVSLAAIR